MKKNFCLSLFTILIDTILILNLSCKKTTVIENPFANITTLDCRNLVIRKVELKDTSFLGDTAVEITIENTCKNCRDDWAYLSIYMVDRQTHLDTLALMDCFCLICPKNGQTEKYQLYTKLKTLPDLNTVQFDFGYLCTDVTYLPK